MWFGRRRRQAGKEATYTRSAQPPGKAYAVLIRGTELTPGYSYSCKKNPVTKHTLNPVQSSYVFDEVGDCSGTLR